MTTTTTTTTTMMTTTTTTNKKKFGKNLNKHVKQPAPPIALGAAGGGGGGLGRSSASGSSRSGLLLLSSTTKKSSSGGGGGLLGSKVSSAGGRIGGGGVGQASSSSSALMGGGTTSSVNDALLEAATAEAGMIHNSEKKGTAQLAWGLKEKKMNKEDDGVRVSTDRTEGGNVRESVSARSDGEHYFQDAAEQNVIVSNKNNDPGSSSLPNEFNRTNKSYVNEEQVPSESNTNTNTNTRQQTDDDQVAFMTKLARDRAEKRRKEEEARFQEQSERAAQRLRELENKLKVSINNGPILTNNIASSNHNPGRAAVQSTSSARSWRHNYASSGSGDEVVLERLGSTKGNSGPIISSSSSGAGPPSDVKRNHRTLFDPNRSYSSLVGGIKMRKDAADSLENSNSNPHVVVQSRNSNQETNDGSTNHHVSNENQLKNNSCYRPSQQQQQSHDPAVMADTQPSSVIQLSSYEDRGRGGRSANAGPRMLFDPKSGSMVAAPSSRNREENGNGGNGNGNSNSNGGGGGLFGKGGRKDRSKSKARNNGKDREDCNSNGLILSKKSLSRYTPEDSDTQDEGGDGSKYSKTRNGRRDDTTTPRKEKKKAEKKFDNSSGGRHISYENGHRNTVRSNNTSMRKESWGRHPQQRMRLPRTRGVLYMRDENGILKSADGCEGDQGYGAHSVPGGRVKNEKAFNDFVQKQQRAAQLDGDNSPYFGSKQQQRLFPKGGGRGGGGGSNMPAADFEKGSGNTRYSLNRYHFTKPHSSPTATPKSQLLDNEIPSPVRVKPNEKIELLTGVEESPTLQATASPWAPSEAALAAAAATAQSTNSAENSRIEVNSHNESDVDAIDETEVHARSAIAFIDHKDLVVPQEGKENVSDVKIGLGFDPTENMDAVISTPAGRNHKDTDKVVHIPDLSLNPCHSVDEDSRAHSNNPFGGLGPSLGCPTWGTPSSGVKMGALSDWDLLGTRNKSDGAEPCIISTPDQKDHSTTTTTTITPASSFLSLGNLPGNNNNTWGSGGLVSGFTTLAGTPLASNTEHKISADKD